MPLEVVAIERVAVIPTSRASTTRYDIYATPSARWNSYEVKYSTVDKRIAAVCIAAQASKELVEVRWLSSKWGMRLIAASFVESIDDVASETLNERIKAQEKFALDDKIGTDVYADDETLCHGCFKRWEQTSVGTYRPPPVWIPEAEAYWHRRCWDARTVVKVEEL